MAVYTRVSADEMRSFMDGYDVAPVETFVGIADGVENTNYLLITSEERFILTLYEKRVREDDLPFFLSLMEHLAKRGIPCPVPVPARSGQALGRVAGRPAVLITFLEGVSRSRIEPRNCRAVGAALAAMHEAMEGFPLERANDLSLDSWRHSLTDVDERAEAFLPGLADEVRHDFNRIETTWPTGLPRRVIHGDLFPDNVFFLDDEVSGLIDFYFACTDFLTYDLAVCINAWCFEPDADFNVTKAGQLLAGYRSIRPLADGELAALPVLCSGSAMRFLLTRLADWTTTPSTAMVRPKDPAEYLGRLRFHRAARGPEAYGLGNA